MTESVEMKKVDLNNQLHNGSSACSSQVEVKQDEVEDSTLKKTLMTIIRVFLLLIALYMFIVSLDLMSASFRLVGGRSAGQVFSQSEIFQNPIAGLMVGVLATVLLQSSSTTTSIIVTMTGAGLLTVRQSAYLVMGANIGTSVTNTIVAMSQIANPKEFELSFSGATVHDVFNWLTVICILPIEAAFGILEKLVEFLIQGLLSDAAGNDALRFDIIKVLTKPLTDLLVQLDSSIINDPSKLAEAETILKLCCKSVTGNSTDGSENYGNSSICMLNCTNLAMAMRSGNLSDSIIGLIYVVISLTSLSLCLILLVRTLQALLGDTIKKQIRRLTSSEKYGTAIGYISILVGAIMTFLVQSSSVFTSAVTPLVGTGVIELSVMYPLTLGSNIGTTITSLLAALASGTGPALETSLIHLFFNISGIIIWYPVPIMRSIPISVAKLLGRTTGKYRWFALFYLLSCFLVLPMAFFGLSIIHWAASVTFAVLIVLLIAFVAIVNTLQRKRPQWLPTLLKDWMWLPLPLRSLQPLDNLFRKAYYAICCKKASVSDQEEAGGRRNSSSNQESIDNGSSTEADNDGFDNNDEKVIDQQTAGTRL